MSYNFTFRNLKGSLLLLLVSFLGFSQVWAQGLQRFTTSGTFTVPACVTSITIMCWGGGGGGGWAGEPGSGAAGSGGGGGGFAQATLNNPSGTFTVTVGGAGVGGIGSSSTNATAGGNTIVTNGTITVTASGGGAGVGSSSGVASPGGAGGTGTFVGCTGTFHTGGSGAIGNNGDDNTGGAGGGGAGNTGNGGTPAATTQDNNATGGAGGTGVGNPITEYEGGTGGGVSAAYYENGDPGTGIGAGGGGGGGENQFFHGTGYGDGGAGTGGEVIITYTVGTANVTSVTGTGCVGSTVTINGTLLTGATGATINGTALTNLTVSATQITGTIAPGTTSGIVTVNTPCGNASSATAFTVHPLITVNLGNVTFCTSYTFGGQTYTTGGNYTTTVPSTVTGCDSTTNITLVKETQINQNIAEGICQGSGYSFGGNNYTASGVYNDTVTLPGGCDSITTLTLTVYQTINTAIAATICSGNSYPFNGQNLTTSGTYTNTTPSTVTGCDSITTLTLTVNQTPAGGITPSALTNCPGISTTLTAGHANQYLWSDGETTGSISVAPTATTTYTVTESNGTCSATGTATITVNPFSITINPDTTQSCIAAQVTLTCSYTSTNPNAYTWSAIPGTGSSPGISQGVVVYPKVTTIYTVQVSNGSCTATASAVVIVDTPMVSITPAVAGVCVGNSTTITASGGVSYAWSNGVSGAANPVSPTTTTQYTVTATDAKGCTSTDSVTVNVGATPTALFTVTSPVCAGMASTITYTGTSDSNAVYNWYFGGGTANTGTTKGPYQVTWANPGVDTVILNVTDNGCSAVPDTMTVTVKPNPVPVAGAPANFCGGDTDVIGSPANPAYSYVWSPATGLSSDTVSMPFISLINPGTTRLQVTYVVTATSNGCSASDSVQVTVLPAPVAKFTATPSLQQCLTGNRFSFTPNGSSLPTDSFSWTFGANATPAISSSENQSVTYSTPQTTAVTLSISRAGCISNLYVDSVTIFPEPVAAFNATPVTGCPGVSICFNNTSTTVGNNNTYLWTFGDGQTDTTTAPCHAYSAAGVYSVSLLVNANGCPNSVTDSNYITINTAPVASFTPSATIIQQPQTNITFTNTSTNATGYNWSFGGLGTSTDISPTYSFMQYGSYNVTLYAVNANGCTDSAVVPVQILPGQNYFIPNAFTPNGDGKDDDFYIQMQEGVTVIQFTVFDRWGEKVHDGPDAWDGTFNGHLCQPGVYVYLFKIRLVDDMDAVRREGTVTLIR